MGLFICLYVCDVLPPQTKALGEGEVAALEQVGEARLVEQGWDWLEKVGHFALSNNKTYHTIP